MTEAKKYWFQVITKIPDPNKGESGNLYHDVPYVEIEEPSEGNGWVPPVASYYTVEPFKTLIKQPGFPMFMHPCFELGEILVVNEHGREITGMGRKASKWFVEYETFNTIDEAIARALEVQEQYWAEVKSAQLTDQISSLER